MSTETERFTRSQYTVTIDDGEVRNWPHSRSGRTYRVAVVNVEVHHLSEGPKLLTPELRGPQVKKDGADGQQWASERMYTYANRFPQWLVDVLDDVRADANRLTWTPSPVASATDTTGADT